MPHYKEAWCSGVDFLYSIDYEGMVDRGDVLPERDVTTLSAADLRILPDTPGDWAAGAIVGLAAAVPGGGALPSSRVLRLTGGDKGDPLDWVPLSAFTDKSWRKVSGLPFRVGEALRSGRASPALTSPQLNIMKDCLQSLATSKD